jgi:peptide/nickel transport system substrate-binding protein
MKAAGINASLQGVSSNAWTAATAAGQYQLTFCGEWQSGGPYSVFNAMLNGSLGAPVGQSAVSNVVRWNDPKTNDLLAQFRESGDSATQTQAIQGIASIIASQNPVIPLMSVSSFGSYSTKHVTGWPTAANPYQTDNIQTPFVEDVLLHLKPAA